jgi:hypothetical protein
MPTGKNDWLGADADSLFGPSWGFPGSALKTAARPLDTLV